MTQMRLSMRNIKEILRLSWGLGLGKRQVARSCSISHSTVIEYLRRAEKAALRWPLPDGLDETALEALLYPSPDRTFQGIRRYIPFEYIHKELRRKGVTLQLLWDEYKEANLDGYQYSQFCKLYREWEGKLDVTLRQEHRAGEKLFVDHAGQTVPITDRRTGKKTQAQIFVAVLGASNYSYVEATLRQDLPSWIAAHVRAFEHFGGVTEIIVPDNTTTGVTHPCRYEPDLNLTYHEMALHYGTAVIPTRSGKPRDKAKVEAGVLVVERWILAALRNWTFFSIEELNEAIASLLERLNTRKFKKLDTSRKELFLTLDKPALKPLPTRPYEFAEWKKARVNIDYHIEIYEHYYSVPYQLVHKEVECRITSSTVEVIYKGRRITAHKRSSLKGAFTTLAEHRPKSHQKYLEWTPSRIINWAKKNGLYTGKVVEKILETKPHPEQGYRSCLGIIRLGERYSTERVEEACKRAYIFNASSYKSIKSILKTGLDRKPIKAIKTEEPTSISHPNLRGGKYYRD